MNYSSYSIQTDNSNYAPPPVSKLSGNVGENFAQYVVEKLRLNAADVNYYMNKRDFYKVGLKAGAVIALIGCLNQMGIDADCECDTSATGIMTFKTITVEDEIIWGSSKDKR